MNLQTNVKQRQAWFKSCTKKALICHPFRALVDVVFVDGRCPSQADVALSVLYYGWQLGTQPGLNFAGPERD